MILEIVKEVKIKMIQEQNKISAKVGKLHDLEMIRNYLFLKQLNIDYNSLCNTKEKIARSTSRNRQIFIHCYFIITKYKS